jgi:hypothetical protein
MEKIKTATEIQIDLLNWIRANKKLPKMENAVVIWILDINQSYVTGGVTQKTLINIREQYLDEYLKSKK